MQKTIDGREISYRYTIVLKLTKSLNFRKENLEQETAQNVDGGDGGGGGDEDLLLIQNLEQIHTKEALLPLLAPLQA
jgi:hypothetical protein